MKEPVYRAKQILSWVYDKGATTFDQMSNLSKDFRCRLSEKAPAIQSNVDTITQTAHGTEKFLIHLADDNVIESVLLREDKGSLRVFPHK
ncbi:MAG: hypothetical protein HS132_16725 [Planctomycetia bacterium]|nr:hypothetical protein [Planctomycetia bacterium]